MACSMTRVLAAMACGMTLFASSSLVEEADATGSRQLARGCEHRGRGETLSCCACVARVCGSVVPRRLALRGGVAASRPAETG
jgi:hypothetical protein